MSAGSIRKDHQRGTWYFTVDVPSPDGGRRQVHRRGFRTQKDAQAGLDKLRGQVLAGRAVGPHRLTFGEFLTSRWLPHLESDGRLKATTKASYRNAVRHLVRHAGAVRLADLAGDHLDAVQAALGDRSASLRHSVHVCARKSLNDAVRWRLVAVNAANDATPPEQPRARPAAWTAAEVTTFLAHAEDDRWWPLWRLAATTGMRRGELVGLRWEHVRLDTAELTVAENHAVADGRVHQGTTKTDRARAIRLDTATVSVLRTWRAQQAAELLLLGELRPGHDHVFTWQDGSVVHPNVVTRTFGRLVGGAGVPALRLHALRHAWATNALAAGVDVKDVATRLGHSSTRITYDIYVAPSNDRDAAAAALVAGLYSTGRGHSVVTEPPGSTVT